MHQRMAAALDKVIEDIHSIQREARRSGGNGSEAQPPCWPLIILRSPKGWTGPKQVDGQKVEGFWRAHQVPLDKVRENPEHLRLLEQWMRSYRPQELFGEAGGVVPEIAALAPTGTRRMSANPHANGGLLRRELRLPDFQAYAVEVANPGGSQAEATRVMGLYLRDVVRLNAKERNFRLMGRTRPHPIAWTTSSRPLIASGWKRLSPTMYISHDTVACWRCSANTCAKAGSKATC